MKKLSNGEKKLLQTLIENDDFVGILIASAYRADQDKEISKLFYQVVDDFQAEFKKMIVKQSIWNTISKPDLIRIIDNDDVACEIVLSYNEVEDETLQVEPFKENFIPKIKML